MTRNATAASLALVIFAAIFVFKTAQAQNEQGVLDSASQSEGPVGSALRAELSLRGLDEDEIDDIFFAVGSRLLHAGDFTTARKRAGWKRIPSPSRFATFGTKLVPSRNRGESNRPTLLRYGRSS